MRLTEKKIEEVVKYAVGNDVLKLVKKLSKKDNISEFKLADQLKEDIKRVRNMLYRLYELNLVSFNRKKDKKKGWYIYSWTFKKDQIKYLYHKIKKERLDKLQETLEYEQKEQYFICPDNCVRLNFDQAVNFEFRCPECNKLVSQEDLSKRIEEIKKEVKELKKELAKI
ncbi:MAG: hypothetical protein KAT77_02265 [Nanoarchaeota archaeon]|nr:hypothetical protein [Nanoarchaeota archaeon]